MRATESTSTLETLKLDSRRIESLSEPDLCALIGFLEDDYRLRQLPSQPRHTEERRRSGSDPSAPRAV